MRKLGFVLAVGLLVFIFATTSAFGFSFLKPWVGGIKFKYANREQETPGTGNGNGIIDQIGEQLDGIFKITSIHALDPSETLLWYDGKDGEELTGEFKGYTAAAITPGPTGLDIYFTGGTFDMYLDNTPDFAFTYPGVGVTDGTLFLSAVGTPGIIPPGPGPPITLAAHLDALTAPFTGKGAGYLQITGGSHAALFAQNGFGPGQDLFLNSDFSAPGSDGWPINSDDPVTGSIVPGPASILLLASGLIGLIGFRRKN
jgi:hypothetical protein